MVFKSKKVRLPPWKRGMISELIIEISTTLFSPFGKRIDEMRDERLPRSFVNKCLKTISIFRGIYWLIDK
jgi:hypothetical protein